ncbi:MAG TPA: DUF1206 domain-containing protein [Novosphingobium sp.]|nr:DUF1206 domain-containing protein [Novosphingobium sp.]
MAQAARLDWIAKVGFVARGIVYILFGWIALSARSKAEEGQKGVFDTVHDMPAGNLLLSLIALGLFAYGVYRVTCALLDVEGKGSEPKGLAGRAAQLGSGIIHLALAYTATQFLGGDKQAAAGTGDAKSEQAARTLLDFELGGAALWLVAAGFFFAAGLQVRKAWKGSHMKQCAPDTPSGAKTIGRIGLVTRGAVFAVVGWSFVRVAQTHSAGEARALGSAVASLQDNPTIYTAVACGLILFGVFSLLLARYRIVPAIDVVDAARSKVT